MGNVLCSGTVVWVAAVGGARYRERSGINASRGAGHRWQAVDGARTCTAIAETWGDGQRSAAGGRWPVMAASRGGASREHFTCTTRRDSAARQASVVASGDVVE